MKSRGLPHQPVHLNPYHKGCDGCAHYCAHDADVIKLFQRAAVWPDVCERRQEVGGGGAAAKGNQRRAAGGVACADQCCQAQQGCPGHGMAPKVDALIGVVQHAVPPGCVWEASCRRSRGPARQQAAGGWIVQLPPVRHLGLPRVVAVSMIAHVAAWPSLMLVPLDGRASDRHDRRRCNCKCPRFCQTSCWTSKRDRCKVREIGRAHV